MTHAKWLLCAAVLALPAWPQQGFQSLFNGKDFTGWDNPVKAWEIQDGAIYRARGGSNLTYTAQKMPDDFELRFEWKVAPGSNSGVYYRPGQMEYQILDNEKHQDGRNPLTSAASLYSVAAPVRDATRPVGEWNEARIVCRGTTIEHWLNGEKVVDLDYTKPKWADAINGLRQRGTDITAKGGQLLLQDHGDPVWYRNFQLRKLPRIQAQRPCWLLEPFRGRPARCLGSALRHGLLHGE